MKILFNNDKLMRLLGNLHIYTGIKTSIFDAGGKELLAFGGRMEFCRLINADPEGHRRCVSCDTQAAERCAQAGSIYRYRCHAGLCEVTLPLYESGVAIAFLSFGQYLDTSPVERQWEWTERELDWYKGDMKALREAFWDLRQYSYQEVTAYAEILDALTVYILREGLVRSVAYTDIQRLRMYLDEHFRESLTLGRISADLRIGTTKLCALAKELSGGRTMTRLIAQRRVEEACAMLLQDDTPVSAVAERVGYNDYNYFTKVFKAITGMTPSAYRKAGGR